MADIPVAARLLAEMQPQREFFVGIDSDGCAFDTMEPKHKECFCPNFVRAFHLASVSKYAREAWDFVNLYSTSRGCNRWHALMQALDWLRVRPEVIRRGVRIPEYPEIRKFIASGLPLSNAGLREYMQKVSSSELQQAWDWTDGVNKSVAATVHHVPPFPLVRESLEALAPLADVVVVSATPGEALVREWEEHNLSKFARVIAGQEMGTKSEHLKLAASGKYPQAKILMAGDALGDLKAARSIHALFFPINPGAEEDSWALFYREGLRRFTEGKYSGQYEEALIAKFKQYLPEVPPWQRTAGQASCQSGMV